MTGSDMDLEEDNQPMEVLRGDLNWKEYFDKYGHPKERRER